jgi:hypothetical protein
MAPAAFLVGLTAILLWIAWMLVRGFVTGEMAPLHWGLDAANRSDRPILFWFYAGLNGILLIVGVAASIDLWTRVQ